MMRNVFVPLSVIILIGATAGCGACLRSYKFSPGTSSSPDAVVTWVTKGSDWESLVAMLKHEEGFRAFAYPDTRGFSTIGYGTKLPLTNAEKNCVNFVNLSGTGPGLKKSQGDCLLRYRLSGYYNEIWARWAPFKQQKEPVQMALLDMCYQLGVDGLLEFELMLVAVAARDWPRAIIEARSSKWDKETPEREHRVVNVFARQETT